MKAIFDAAISEREPGAMNRGVGLDQRERKGSYCEVGLGNRDAFAKRESRSRAENQSSVRRGDLGFGRLKFNSSTDEQSRGV